MQVNESKSCVYLARVLEEMKQQILQFLNFREGFLPVIYLGLPLVSTSIKKEHCQKLISIITSRIDSWSAK